MKQEDGWLLPFWSAVFGFLAKLSLFVLIRRLLGPSRSGYRFVEAYVLGNTLLAAVTLVVASGRYQQDVTLLLEILSVYAVLRVFEVTVYQVNVLLFDEYRAQRAGRPYAVKGYRRMVILLLHNYAELVFWFGVLHVYLLRAGDIVYPDGQMFSFIALLRDSILMMSTFQTQFGTAQSNLGIWVLSIHSVVGLVMTLLVLARFVALLPRPATMERSEDRD